MNKTDCRNCGLCCIICTDVQLTKEEARMQIYISTKRNGQGPLNGWSNLVLKRRKIYVEELKKSICACIYFDPTDRTCTIYDKRPKVCRVFDCYNDTNYPSTKIERLKEIWEQIKQGKQFLCLEK